VVPEDFRARTSKRIPGRNADRPERQIEQADVVGRIGFFFTAPATMAYLLLAAVTWLLPRFSEADPEKGVI